MFKGNIFFNDGVTGFLTGRPQIEKTKKNMLNHEMPPPAAFSL